MSLLLRLTADLLEAAPGYPPFATSSTADDNENEEEGMSTSGGSGGSVSEEVSTKYPLVELFNTLYDLDNAWAAVLSCQVWNREARRGEDVVISFGDTNGQDDALDAGDISEIPIYEEHGIKLYAPSATECTRLRSIILGGMSMIEDWLDEGRVPDKAKEPFAECFDWTLRLLGDDTNEASWIEDGFVRCGAPAK